MNTAEMKVSALLDLYVYLDIQNQEYAGKSMREILNSQSFKAKIVTDEQRHHYEILKDAVDPSNGETYNKSFSEARLRSQSFADTSLKIPKDELVACGFSTPDGTHYVAYRGTGDGQWVDNGEGMYKESTLMQRRAAEYFDHYIESRGLAESDNIIVTGHSKGGNSAQYVSLASKYARLVDACYSLDGQGFSRKAIEMFKQHLGSGYQTQIDKLYSINGDNDYVHDLGIAVIPEDSTYFVKLPDGVDFAGMHALPFMLTNGQLIIDSNVEQGEVGKFAKKLSEEMMKLNDEDLEDCALSIMSLLESFMGGEGGNIKEGTGTVKSASVEEFCGLISVGIPMILKTAVLTEEGRAMIGSLVMNAISGIAEGENGGWKLAGLAALAFMCAPAIVAVGKIAIVVGGAIWIGATIIDCILDAFSGDLSAANFASLAAIAVIQPQLALAVLAVIGVISLIKHIVDHWDEITAFFKSVGNWIVGLGTTLLSWVENLTNTVIDMIKTAVGKAVKLYQDAKQAIINFGNQLMAAAANFFSRVGQAVEGFFKGVGNWFKNLFGSASGALSMAGQIVVTINRIDEMQRQIAMLRQYYLDAKTDTGNAKAIVSQVYYYYNESYVRSCCRDIENDIKNAQKYIDAAERELGRKRRVLAEAVESYRKADRDAVGTVRKAAPSYT